MSVVIPADRVASVAGFGMRNPAAGYVFRPTSVKEIRQILELSKNSSRQVTLRGAGRSYGDANSGAECIVVDISRMRRILSWDASTGLIDCEAGVTIEGLWRLILEDGYWPPVVSGTMYPTLAGALAMNIHGKNNFRVGTLGEHVVDMDVLFPTGELKTLTPTDDLFYSIIGSAGLLGIIVRIKMQMKRIHGGDLAVYARSCRNWDEQFAAFEEFESDSDYMVSWVDLFARDNAGGRGQFHAAFYVQNGDHSTLTVDHQDLPDTIMGLVPKSVIWRALKLLSNRPGMRFINWAKHTASAIRGRGAMHHKSLVGFSFLLDYVPNWRYAYLPDGFIQYQSFIPKEHAKRVFKRQAEMQQEAGLESFLGVMKRHRRDKFLFSHGVDGYSLALDFKVTRSNWLRLEALAHRMNNLVLEAGGRFYFAKDSTLRPADLAYLGDSVAQYHVLKAELDPDSLLTSDLARRLGLDSCTKI